MILINGNFLCRSLTGIERFAWETCKNLDELITKDDDIAILVPQNAQRLYEYKNIKIIYAKPLKSFPKWDMFYFSKMCKKLNATALNFSNTAPLGKKCGISFIHDIYAKDFPEDFKSFKDRLIRAYSLFHYKNIAKNAALILTVSEFSKEQIQKSYKVAQNKIAVIPNGWEHFKSVSEDDVIFKKFPALLKKEFFFTLGSLQKRKNLNWILSYAKDHPKQFFAISGKTIGGMKSNIDSFKELSNVIFLGYLSDGEVKSLMKKCRAFIFPSYYEGFGIPPLEALSTGCPVITSKAASLPEIYRDTVHYIDPASTDIDLENLLNQKVSTPDKILLTYTYKNAAKKLLEVLREKRFCKPEQ